MLCKKCKKQIEDDSIFCRFCGKKLVSEEKPRKKQKRPHGSGSVYKLPGKRSKPFVARITQAGKLVPIGTLPTPTEALLALESVQLNGVSNIYNATVEDIYNMVIDQKEEKISSATLTNYAACWGYLNVLDKTKMRDVRTLHFQHVIDDAYKAGLSYSTLHKIQILLVFLQIKLYLYHSQLLYIIGYITNL